MATLPTPSAPPNPSTSGVFYGGVDDTLVYVGSSSDHGVPSTHSHDVALDPNPGLAPPRFYKLEFPTYDGATDPLHWLNQCEQFFRG
jgi:hypothetical protein